MPAGYGENAIRARFNAKWGTRGYCFRMPQHKSDPAAVSDLVAGIGGHKTFSIEVKRITNKKKGTGYTTQPLSFTRHFSISTRPDIEFPHQLERQVRLSQRLGWYPVLLLQCVSPYVGTQEYLFNSDDLLQIMLDGKKSVYSSLFPELHRKELYEYMFKTGADIPLKRTTKRK